MARRWMAAVAIAVLAAMFSGRAEAGAVADAAAGLRAAIQARAADPGATTKEKAKLPVADNALGVVDDEIDATDLNALLTGGKALVKSKTTDPAIVDAAAALAQGLIDVAEARADEIEAALAQVYPTAVVRAAVNQVNAARAAVENVRQQILANPAAAIVSMRNVLVRLNRLSARADTFVDRTAPGGRFVRIRTNMVGFNDAGSVVIVSVSVSVTATEGDRTETVSRNVTPLIPSSSGYRLPFTMTSSGPFYLLSNAVGYALTAAGFDSPSSVNGVVRLKFQDGTTADFPYPY